MGYCDIEVTIENTVLASALAIKTNQCNKSTDNLEDFKWRAAHANPYGADR